MCKKEKDSREINSAILYHLKLLYQYFKITVLQFSQIEAAILVL